MDRRVTPPKLVTSPMWGTPPPCKQALICNFCLSFAIFPILMTKDRQTLNFNDKGQTKVRNSLMLISVCFSEFL